MSLYDEAILIQKPSGYKAEKLYNVVPSPEVSEQSSLEFDGVDDELITDGDSVAQPTTYSFWAKSSETGANKGVFGHGGKDKCAFHFAYDNTRPLLYLNPSYYRYWDDTSAQDDGEWHHWVVYSDTNDITNSKLYVDGVLQDVSSTGNSGSSNAYTEGLTIGSDRQSSGNYFEGSISDFAVFSSELSAADVTEIYNYGSPNDLLETSFVNDLESYYQMGDGILDEYPLIADQTNATLGSELVTNGDFDTDSDWTKGGQWTIGSGVATCTGNSSSQNLSQSDVLIADTFYRYSIDIISSNLSAQDVRILENNNSVIATLTLSGGAETLIGYFTTTETGAFRIRVASGNTSGTLTIDNISVKKVQGNPAMMTNMSSDDIVAWTPNIETDFDVARSSWTTRINASGYIEQVAANVPRLNYDSGDSCPYLLTEAASTNLITYPISFGNSYWTKSGASIEGDSTLTLTGTDVASGWDFTSGWTASGTASIDSATSFTLNAAADYVDKKYTTLTGDAVLIRIVGTKDGGTLDIRDRDGTSGSNYAITDNTFDVTFWMNYESSREPLMFHAADGSVGQVNITTMEFYEAQGFEAPKEIPVANSEELVTNGDFEDGSTDWTLDTGWTISGGLLNCNTASANNTRQLFSSYSTDKIYSVTYTISNYVSGGAVINLGYNALTTRTANGTYTEQGQFIDGGAFGGYIRIFADGAAQFSIDNVSVKEVTSWSGGGFEREAYKLVEDTSNGTHKLETRISGLAIGNTYAVSLYAKACERNWIALRLQGFEGGSYYDLTNGVVGSDEGSTPLTSDITELANGWYRIDFTCDLAVVNDPLIYIYTADSDGGKSYQGDGSSGLYIAYAQLEENGYASSLMLPTTEGSTTSRVGDVVNNAGNSLLLSNVNSSGVLYAEIAANSDDLTTRRITLSDGTANNRIFLSFYGGSSNRIRMYLTVDNVNVADQYYDITDITQFSKFGIRWTLNDFSLWVDGTEVATDTSGSTFAADTLTKLNFDNGYGNNNFYGKTKGVAVFDYLSDDEMETLTT